MCPDNIIVTYLFKKILALVSLSVQFRFRVTVIYKSKFTSCITVRYKIASSSDQLRKESKGENMEWKKERKKERKTEREVRKVEQKVWTIRAPPLHRGRKQKGKNRKKKGSKEEVKTG